MLKQTSQKKKEARVRYLKADLQVLSQGDFVRCAVTNRAIPLEALRYWSVAYQEAYVDADAASRRLGYGDPS
ncbi:MAG: DUF2093 domain-containing protein [Pseudomonadota bacterium]